MIHLPCSFNFFLCIAKHHDLVKRNSSSRTPTPKDCVAEMTSGMVLQSRRNWTVSLLLAEFISERIRCLAMSLKLSFSSFSNRCSLTSERVAHWIRIWSMLPGTCSEHREQFPSDPLLKCLASSSERYLPLTRRACGIDLQISYELLPHDSVSYKLLTLPTNRGCRSRWSPYN